MTNQEIKNQQQRTMKKCRRSLWLSLMVVLALSLVKLALVNRTVTWGRQLEQIETETKTIEADNDRLKLELNRQLGGLDKLEEKAVSLGYVTAPRYRYLSGSESVAQRLP